MPVLKHANARPVIKDAVVLDMGDLDRQAKRIIEEARGEAERILREAREEAAKRTGEAAGIGRAQGMEQGVTEGREEGRHEGRREAIKELKPRLEELLTSWSAALEQWERDRAEMLLAARQDVLAFALQMGRQVVLKTIESDSTVVEKQLVESLAHLTRPTAVTISIHPDDRPLVEEVLPELLATCAQCTHASIREEPAMSRGGCIVSTGTGQIDASIETQIERIVEALLPRATTDEESSS